MVTLYSSELPINWKSAFFTHGVSTWAVLFGGWVLFCVVIEWLGDNVASIKASKLQSVATTNDPDLRAIARRTVTRNWVLVLVQTFMFAPFLKIAFPLGHVQTMSLQQYAFFFALWAVSNDFLFTMFHTLFHEIPWLYKFAHKEHHTWKAPFVWMSHAMSFTEMTANAVGVMFYPLFHAFVLHQTTPMELVWTVQLVSQLIGCIEHSGYNALPPLLLIKANYFPAWLFSTTQSHDDHHRYFQGNYGGYLAVWDAIMGTTILPGKTSYKAG